jgi:hypothetical protein
MKARKLIEDAAFGPETLKVVSIAFDQAWASIEDHFRGEDDKIVEQPRIRLAHAVLAVAREETEDVARLANDALAVMAMSRRKR